MLLITAVLAFSLAFQGSRGLWERDEGRYTSVALQMIRSGNFLIPAYNDEVVHLTKPPLTYWAIAGGMAVLGRNEWGARLPNAIAFAATLFVLWGLARRITPDRPWLPPLVYATSILPFVAANIVTTDTLLALWEVSAVGAFVAWRDREDRPRRALLLTMWAAFALAFLTKGPPGLLPLLAIMAFSVLERGWRSLLSLFHPLGLLVFLVLGLSWYGAVEIVRPGTLRYWVHDELLARVISDKHHRNAQWYKAFTIYGPVLAIGCLPWLVPALGGIVRSVKEIAALVRWRERMAQDPWPCLLMLWGFLPLTVFLLSSSRLPLYVLPLMAPLALAMARWVNPPFRRHRSISLLVAWAMVLLAGKFIASRVTVRQDSRVLAKAVLATVQAHPREILFVDTKPYWGLSLYLQSEVERIDTDPTVLDREEGSEPFAAEMGANESGRLMIVDQERVDRILGLCRAHGFNTRVTGGYASWRFIPLPDRKE